MTGCAIVNALYEAAGRNRLYAVQGRASTNAVAAEVRSLFRADEELTRFTSVWEPGGKAGNPIAQLYGVSGNDVGIPRTYVIDRQGVIRFVGHPSDLSSDLIEALL